MKLNFSPIELVYVLRGIFLGKKILLVNDNDEFINNQFLHFLTYVYHNSFEFRIKIENNQVYKNNKKQYREYLIIDKERIVKDKGKIIFPKNCFLLLVEK